jgi:hypothetical protein
MATDDISPILRTFSAESQALDEPAGIYEATITTESPDRSEDVIMASGGRFENYKRNPVVLWAHRYGEPPVARALEVIPILGGIKSIFQFPPAGLSARADEVHALWRAKFLNAVSIGLLPLKQEPVDPNDKRWFAPQRYVEWDMLEFSIVPIPMNPDALRASLARTYGAYEQEERIAEQERQFTAFVSRYLKTLQEVLREH